MKDLNELLDSTFGVKDVSRTKKQEVKDSFRQQRGLYLTKDECKDLIISLNYAINSIKNKKEVVEKKENATRYIYYKRWTKIRQKIQQKLKQ